VKNKRPKNLNLLTIRFPIPAFVSILHRISGFILFLLIPFMLWALKASITTEAGFYEIYQSFTTPVAKFIIWCCLSALLYHTVAGIRHLLMDINIGIELKSGKFSAMLTIIVAIFLMILAGIWVW
jgi:succinate dehydrogenase / fumarate reductase cytochrome b subunit